MTGTDVRPYAEIWTVDELFEATEEFCRKPAAERVRLAPHLDTAATRVFAYERSKAVLEIRDAPGERPTVEAQAAELGMKRQQLYVLTKEARARCAEAERVRLEKAERARGGKA